MRLSELIRIVPKCCHARDSIESRTAPAAVLAALLLSSSAAANQDHAPANEKDEPGWRHSVRTHVTESMADIEEFADTHWRGFARDLGLIEPRYISSYSGYGNAEHVWIRGRLLANPPYGGPQEDDDWWDNLQATYQRWDSDEVPDALVTLRYGNQETEIRTDDEGYYQAVFSRPDALRDDTVIARHEAGDRVLTATHRVYLPLPRAEFIVISDMDDTVIHTGITNMLLAARLTFLHNAKTRKPLAGIGALYQSLVRGRHGDEPVNQVFYVSNSAWNLWDLLRDFIELNDLPAGPLLLRDIGIGSDTSDHKITAIRNLMRRYASLPVLLVGDSGQHDAEIYARIATEFPGRVMAIYVRDVDPDDHSEYDENVDRIIERSRDLGVPFLRVAHSAEIAEHAAAIGVLPATVVADVRSEVVRDRHRDTLGEKPGPENTR